MARERLHSDFSRLHAGLLLVVAGILFGVSAAAEPGSKICVQDDLSRQVCVPGFPKRVVSLAPSLTEIVFDLGVGCRLVGRTERCNEPVDALKVPDIGAYLNPDLERIIALGPDLVLSPEAGMRKEVVNRLAGLGIPTFVDNSSSLDQITDSVKRLGTILGRESRADKIVERFQQRRQAVRDRVEHAQKPLVVFAIGIRPLVLAGGKSFIGSLIREAGGINIAEEASVPYPKFSMEEVARRDPDIIVVLNKECQDNECFTAWQAHRYLKAVRNGKIYQVDADLIARPAPKIMDAFEQLAGILHPKLFATPLAAGVHTPK